MIYKSIMSNKQCAISPSPTCMVFFSNNNVSYNLKKKHVFYYLSGLMEMIYAIFGCIRLDT